MEEIIDFDEWLKTYIPAEPKYYAIYDIDTGELTGVYPEHSSTDLENKIEVEKEFAELIFEGKIPLASFYVDLSSETLEIVQIRSLRKIDDILHRIVDERYSEIFDPDITVEYYLKRKKIGFRLREKLREKKIKWSGETELKFIISSYNDPHKIYQVINFSLNDIYEKDLDFSYIGIDENFSVFTIRVFKKYILKRYEDN